MHEEQFAGMGSDPPVIEQGCGCGREHEESQVLHRFVDNRDHEEGGPEGDITDHADEKLADPNEMAASVQGAKALAKTFKVALDPNNE